MEKDFVIEISRRVLIQLFVTVEPLVGRIVAKLGLALEASLKVKLKLTYQRKCTEEIPMETYGCFSGFKLAYSHCKRMGITSPVQFKSKSLSSLPQRCGS